MILVCRGVHFAITESEATALKARNDNQSRLEYLHEHIIETYFSQHPELLAESDKAWDAMHRLLADDGELSYDEDLIYDSGAYPLNHVVLAGESLYGGDDSIISLKSPYQVRDIHNALEQLSESEFRSRYFLLEGSSYEGDIGEEDYEYTWVWFQDVRALFQRAATEGRFVLFFVDL
jgi:Domain of unknown function (DUF1877)